ncbi:MAG: hypothetical protein PHF86_05610 [Candidatus Nanoarchaeia archaeon]|nr:hypothetical protein [Candidatus Nanoarchaeia archaeon]
MKKDLWFRAKKYGYGWYPINWKGWIVILIYVILLISWITLFFNFYSLEKNWIIYLIGIFILSSILVFISWKKGEKARWRWGD